jgi:hypothetical protein
MTGPRDDSGDRSSVIRFRVGVSVIAAVVALSLAGCTATINTATPTNSAAPSVAPSVAPTVADTPSATPTATPTPTPTPTPTKPTLDSLVASPDGLGSLVIGQPVPAVPPTIALAVFNSDHCNRPGEAGDAGWDSTYPNKSFSMTTKPVTATGKVSLILINTTRIATASGIRKGSTRAQVVAAYGASARIVHAGASDIYVVKGAHGQIAFDVARQVTFGSKKTPYWSTKEVDHVQTVTIWQLGATPVSFIGTDGGPGSCA